MSAREEINEEELLDELEALLAAVASGGLPNRAESTNYSRCRMLLLESRLRPSLPGFLYQCMSLMKFRDFITLYDRNPAERVAFLKSAFHHSRTAMMTASTRGETNPSRGRGGPPQWSW